jgi:hypothetical protein
MSAYLAMSGDPCFPVLVWSTLRINPSSGFAFDARQGSRPTNLPADGRESPFVVEVSNFRQIIISVEGHPSHGLIHFRILEATASAACSEVKVKRSFFKLADMFSKLPRRPDGVAAGDLAAADGNVIQIRGGFDSTYFTKLQLKRGEGGALL